MALATVHCRVACCALVVSWWSHPQKWKPSLKQVWEGEDGYIRLTRESTMFTMVLPECKRQPSTRSPASKEPSFTSFPQFWICCIQKEDLVVILVAPESTSTSWFLTMVQLLAAKPWQLPWLRDSQSQLNSMTLYFMVLQWSHSHMLAKGVNDMCAVCLRVRPLY